LRHAATIALQHDRGKRHFLIDGSAPVKAQPGNVTTSGPLRVATTVCSNCTVGAFGSL
jgi:hypothetical protein